MSDIRFNTWLHQSGTGGITQVDGGHVGIGTTNPDIAVHTANAKKVNVGIVTANSVYAGNFYGDGSNLTGTGHVDKIIEGDTKVEVVDSGSQYISAEVNGSEKFRIDSTGRISSGKHGVGTYNDSSEWFKVQSNDSAANISIVGSNATHSSLNLGDENDFNIQKIRSDHTNNSLQFFTVNTEKLRIDSGGRLYTGASQTTLDTTAGTIHIDGGTSGGRIALRGTTTSAGGGLGEIFAYWNNTKVAGIIALAGADASNKDDGHLTFYTRPDTATGVQERARITSTGNFGIGTNSPTDKLHVAGTTNFVSNSYIGGDLYMYGNSYGNGVFLGGSHADHKLDYYKTGQWVPEVLDANGSNYSITYTANETRWVRIGHLVYVYYNIQNQENGSKTGDLRMRGFPFTVKAFQTGGQYWVDHSSPSSGLGDIVGGTHRITHSSGNNTIYWVKPTDKSGMGYASSRYLTHGQWSYGRWIYGSFMYEISD